MKTLWKMIGAVGLGVGGTAVAQHMPSASSEQPLATPVGQLVDFVPGKAECEGGAAVPVRTEPPFPSYAMGAPGLKSMSATMTFDINADGRPVRIAHRQAPLTPPYLYTASEDVLPAFTAWRFAAGQPRTGCRVRFEAIATVATEAPVTLVRRYYVAPHPRRGDESALFRRIHPADTDCIESGTPRIRVRVYPAFEDIPQAPGTWSYSMTAFEIDRSGKPARVRLAEPGSNPVLDRESIAAVRRSRFAPEARRGCTYPYHRSATEALAAPAMPDKARYVPEGARCPDGDTGWTFMPALSFPAGFERRRIEGWAIIGYDVASWGAIGNVRVLASEPAVAFGEEAARIVEASRQAASPAGRTGCVDVVRFVMPDAPLIVREQD